MLAGSHSPDILHWKAWLHLLDHPLSGVGKLLLGPLRAILSPGWTRPVLSSLSSCAVPALWPTWWPFAQTSLPMSLLNWGSQNWTQCSSCELTSTEQRGVIKSLNLLAVLLFIPGHCQSSLLPGYTSCSHPAHCPPGPPGPFQKCCSQPGSPSKILLPPTFPRKNFAFGLVEFHKVPVGPLLQPVQLPLNGSVSTSISTSSPWPTPWFGFICKFYKKALHRFLQVIDKDAKTEQLPG